MLLVLLTMLGALSGEPMVCDPPHVTMTITSSFSPFEVVTYDVAKRAKGAFVVKGHHYAGSSEYSQDMTVISFDDLDALVDVLVDEGLLTLESSPPGPDAFRTVAIEACLPEGKVDVTLADPTAAPMGAAGAVVTTVVTSIDGLVPPLPFKNVYFEPGTTGYLNLASYPIADITIDGIAVGVATPIFAWELDAGDHTLELVSVPTGITRTYTFTISPGVTTLLNLDLR